MGPTGLVQPETGISGDTKICEKPGAETGIDFGLFEISVQGAQISVSNMRLYHLGSF